MKNTVFITGANRGIGFEFAKQYAEEGWTVYATCRDPEQATALKKLAKQYQAIHMMKLDLNLEDEINFLSQQLNNIPIDVVINNAGILIGQYVNLSNLTSNQFIESYKINAIAPLLVFRALAPNLKLGTMKKMIAVSSIASSLSANLSEQWNIYPYKASKAALNMLMRCLSLEPEYIDLTVLLVDPGWVQTDMGGQEADIEPKVSVLGMREVIQRQDIPSGSFVGYDGKHRAW